MRPELTFTFTASPGAAQTDGHDRRVRPLVRADGGLDPGQVWCRGDRAFVYPVRPADPQPEPARTLERLAADPGFPGRLELPSAGGRSGLGANLLRRRAGAARALPPDRRPRVRGRQLQRLAAPWPPAA